MHLAGFFQGRQIALGSVYYTHSTGLSLSSDDTPGGLDFALVNAPEAHLPGEEYNMESITYIYCTITLAGFSYVKLEQYSCWARTSTYPRQAGAPTSAP